MEMKVRVLFQEKDGSQLASQIHAYGDIWHWNEAAAQTERRDNSHASPRL